MKPWSLVVLPLLFVSLAFAAEEFPSDRYVLEGEVRYGRYINCQLFNETQNDLRVQRYVYEVWSRGYYGQIEKQTHLFQCLSGCHLESFSMLRLSGPPVTQHIVRASCKALVRRLNWDDGNDDDYNLRRPQVFDRWH